MSNRPTTGVVRGHRNLIEQFAKNPAQENQRQYELSRDSSNFLLSILGISSVLPPPLTHGSSILASCSAKSCAQDEQLISAFPTAQRYRVLERRWQRNFGR